MQALSPLQSDCAVGMHGLSRSSIRPLRSIVLTCHDVFEKEPAMPLEFGISISVQAFAEGIAEIEAMGYRFVDFATFLAGHSRGNLALMTFDDAFVSALEHALPLLARRNIPSVIFLISRSLFDKGDPFPTWLHLMKHRSGSARILASHGLLAEALAAASYPTFDDFLAAPIADVEQRFANCLSPEQLSALSALVSQTPGLGRVTATHKQIPDHPLVAFGAHSRSHRSFASIGSVEIDNEITGSLSDLASITGQPAKQIPFCYPYGAVTVHARGTVGLHAAAGFTCAERPVCRLDPLAALPRFNFDDHLLVKIASATRWRMHLSRVRERTHLRLRTGAAWRLIAPLHKLAQWVMP